MAVSPIPASKVKAARGKPEAAAPPSSPTPADGSSAPRKRTKDPGVRVVGGRIYDSQNGKTCHQCRQKTMDFFAPCKSERNGKPCPICFCHKCLLNRYGEKAEDAAKSDNWSCPRCRGVCNCSFCMKKKGHEPTGILVHTAKAIGFSSVSDLLHTKGPAAVKELLAVSAKSPISSMKSGKKDKNQESDSKVGAPELEAKECNEAVKDNVKRPKKRTLKMETCGAGGDHDTKIYTSELETEALNCNRITNGNAKRYKKKVSKTDTFGSNRGPSEHEAKVDASELETEALNCNGVTKAGVKRHKKRASKMGISGASGDSAEHDAKVDTSELEIEALNCNGITKNNVKKHKKKASRMDISGSGGDPGVHEAKVDASELETEALNCNGVTKGKVKKHKNKASKMDTSGASGDSGEHEAKVDAPELEIEALNCNGVAKVTVKKHKKKASKIDPCEASVKHKMPKVKMDKVNDNGGVLLLEDKNPAITANEKKMKKMEKMSDEDKKKSVKLKEEKKNLNIQNEKDGGIEMQATQGTEVLQPKRRKRNALRDVATDLIIPLPQGSVLTTVAGLELEADNVGPVLQFLEFCVAFDKVLGLKKGQAETVLRELSRGPVGRRGVPSSIVLFHIKLLSIILKDIGEKPPSSAANEGLWLQELENCINNSECTIKGIPTGLFRKGIAGYNTLDFSEKLRILNFLCDEALTTGELRCWIDEQNEKFKEKKKDDKKKYIAAKEKEKSIKQTLKDELAQALLSLRTDASTLTIAEHDNLLSTINAKTEQIHSRLQDSMDMQPKKKQRSDAVRTEPALLEGTGQAFWRLRCCESTQGILLQDIGCLESISANDKWFMYDDEQQKIVEKHIVLVRKQRLKKIKSLLSEEASLLNDDNADNALPAAEIAP